MTYNIVTYKQCATNLQASFAVVYLLMCGSFNVET